VIPDGLVPLLEILSAPQIIDEDVEATVLGADAMDQPFHLVSDEMIHPRVERPVTYTVALAAPSSTAMSLPAARVAPATRATLPLSDIDLSVRAREGGG
jgi:hypothetical protein